MEEVRMTVSNEKVEKYESKKSNSTFIVRGTDKRAYLIAYGEAATKKKVIDECERIRKQGGDFMTVAWTARMLSNTF